MENLQRMNDSTSCASPCNQQHVLTLDVTEIQRRQKQVLSVLILTVITMVVEIVAGHITGSMALQADGYHMGSHAGALGVAFLAYRMMSWERIRSRMNFGSGKILALGGYSNAIALGFVSLWMIIECIERLLSPKAISFDEALAVAVLGLIVNLASAWLLGWEGGVGHHHHGEHHHGEHHHGEHHHGEHHHGEHHHGEHHHGDHHHGDHHHGDHHHATITTLTITTLPITTITQRWCMCSRMLSPQCLQLLHFLWLVSFPRRPGWILLWALLVRL